MCRDNWDIQLISDISDILQTFLHIFIYMGSLFLFRPKGCMNSWKAKVGWAWNSRIWPNKLVATTRLRSLEKSSFRIILPPMSFTSELRSYSLHDSNAVRSYEIMSQNGRLWHVQGGPTLGGSHIFLCNATCDTESPPLQLWNLLWPRMEVLLQTVARLV